MPTPEEIKKIARKFAELIGGHAVCSETEIQKRALLLEQYTHFLMEDFCIVPKSKVKELYAKVESDHCHVDEDNDWVVDMMLRRMDDVFGSELFNDTEK